MGHLKHHNSLPKLLKNVSVYVSFLFMSSQEIPLYGLDIQCGKCNTITAFADLSRHLLSEYSQSRQNVLTFIILSYGLKNETKDLS